MTFARLIKKRWLYLSIVFILVIIALIAFFEFTYSTKYYPGITINGVSVTGMTEQEVIQKLKTTSDDLQKNGLTVILKGESSTTEIIIPSSAVGLAPDTVVEYFSIQDPTNNINEAYDWGHKGTIIHRLKEQSALVFGKNIDIPALAHKEAIQSLLMREIRHHFIAQAPAQFSFNKNGGVIITPETVSEDMDVDKIVDKVLDQLAKSQSQPITLALQREVPYTTYQRLAPFLPLAEKFATLPKVVFRYKGHAWNVTGKTLTTWLTLKQNNRITVDNDKLETFFSTSIVPFINNPPENSRFKMIDGKLTETSPGIPGSVVNGNKAIESIEEIITQVQKPDFKNTTMPITLETITVDPKVTQKTVEQYHIKDLIGTATTNFTGGSGDRQHNIETGVSKITGMLIAPGQEFSTANAIGMVTEEAGFVKEYVINGNQTVKELGGGLCQLATTLFRTALNAGLPITERKNHKYVIPYYGPGLDATVYGPHPDFRFVNDTGNYLLLQGTAKNNEVIFELYGVFDGRTAKVSTPVLSNEKPVPPDRNILTPSLKKGQVTCTIATHKGITTDVTYAVHYLDGTIKETAFHSVYEAWPRVCLVGTALQ